MNASEPSFMCRKHMDAAETRLQFLVRDEAWAEPADGPRGGRHQDGMSSAQALVRNAGTCGLDAKGDLQVVDP